MTELDRARRALEAVLSRPAPALPAPDAAAVDETVAYLASDEASASLQRDPYWPKWDSPWWRLALLAELTLADRIPARAARGLLAACRARYLDRFPLTLEEVPAGRDPVRDVLCHCALGTLDRVLGRAGVDVDAELPYVRGWYRRYQLSDGGYNCDEAVYTKPVPHSSVVSTLPPLEALLARGSLAPAEEAVLDAGARYLQDRRLCRSLSRGGALIDAAWLAPTFPRFYDYDILRGLTFLSRWAERRRARLGAGAVVEAIEELARRTAPDGALGVGRRGWEGARTLAPDASGSWTRGHRERSFPLLDLVSRPGEPSAALTAEWHATARRLVDQLAA